MLSIITKGIKKLFGDKSERDIKDLAPIVTKINQEFAKLENISHNELRAKSLSIRKEIADYVSTISNEIAELREKARQEETEADEQEDIFRKVDELVKNKDELYEEVLEKVLPEAFAVMKETARRFKTYNEIEVVATERDRDLAAKADFVSIKNNYAVSVLPEYSAAEGNPLPSMYFRA